MGHTILESIDHLGTALDDCKNALNEKGVTLEERPAADEIATHIQKIATFEGGDELKQRVDTIEQNYVHKEEGKSLIEETKIAQIDTNTSDIEELKTNGATKEYVTQAIGKIGTVKGSCLKADLEGKKESSNAGDIWTVTDDNNHLYIYNGTDFIDLGAHIDLSSYATVTQLNEKADQTALQALTETVNTKIDATALTPYATTETVSGVDGRVTALETQLTGINDILSANI